MISESDRSAFTACPDCDSAQEGMTRRELFHAAGGAALAVAAAALPAAPVRAVPRLAQAGATSGAKPESMVKTLFDSLTPRQRETSVLSWSDPLRRKVDANWAIVKPSIHETFTADQQEMIRGILKGVTNEEWYPKFLSQMKADDNGIDNYHVALFQDPHDGRVEWVMTGRHCTIRCGGDPSENMAFGGPIFYGHAVKFNEDAGHPGNIFWYQGKRANEVYQMLDGKQRGEALIALAPDESAVQFRKPGDGLPGIPIGSLSHDQRRHVQLVMADILAPYRKVDVEEVMRDLHASGGLDALHLAFYKQPALANDGVWDIWRLEGPEFVWHFRGAPHVHTWVNIARKA